MSPAPSSLLEKPLHSEKASSRNETHCICDTQLRRLWMESWSTPKGISKRNPIYTRAMNLNNHSSKVKAVILRAMFCWPATMLHQLPTHGWCMLVSASICFCFFLLLAAKKLNKLASVSPRDCHNAMSPFRIKGREECCFIPTTNKHICIKGIPRSPLKEEKCLTHTHTRTHKDIRINM